MPAQNLLCERAGLLPVRQQGQRARRQPELQILISYNRPEESLDTYKKRWQIETMFKAMKSAGSILRIHILLICTGLKNCSCW